MKTPTKRNRSRRYAQTVSIYREPEPRPVKKHLQQKRLHPCNPTWGTRNRILYAEDYYQFKYQHEGIYEMHRKGTYWKPVPLSWGRERKRKDAYCGGHRPHKDFFCGKWTRLLRKEKET